MEKLQLPFIACFIFLAINVFSQHIIKEDAYNTVWFSAGFGIASNDMAKTISLSHQWNANLFSIRQTKLMSYEYLHYTELAILYGRGTMHKRYHLAAAVGPAIVEKDAGETKPGLAFSAQISYRYKYFGIGLYLFSSVNSLEKFSGITLSLQFGKLE